MKIKSSLNERTGNFKSYDEIKQKLNIHVFHGGSQEETSQSWCESP